MTRVLETGSGLIRVSDVLSALSYALDLTEGQVQGHALRTAVIGMRLAAEVGFPLARRNSLYYALLMKDAGCGAAPLDWIGHEPGPRRDGMRAARGSAIARRIGLPPETAIAIANQDETWDGTGQPLGLRGAAIPLSARVLHLAQSVDTAYKICGADAALELTLRRSGTRFDPDLVRGFLTLAARRGFWANVERGSVRLQSQEDSLQATSQTINRICLAFADVVDAKSPFTYRHSTGVAHLATRIAGVLGLPGPEVEVLWRAALLHDIGKLNVPNSILDKPGRLTPAEWTVVRRHPYYSEEILSRIPGFSQVAEIAGAHHEKLDGSGYFRGLAQGEISRSVRILAVADIYDALTARRPYREGLPHDAALRIIEQDVPRALDSDSFHALRSLDVSSLPIGDKLDPQCSGPIYAGLPS